jgi:hypothetical protein
MPRGRVIADDDAEDEEAVARARVAALDAAAALAAAALAAAQPEAPLYQPAPPPPHFLQGHIISAEVTGTSAPADAKRIARKISEFADDMVDNTLNNWAHKRLHDMSAEVFRLAGATSSVPEERLAAAEEAGAERARRETNELLALLQARMTEDLERNRARRDAQREALAQIESNRAREQREIEEVERIEAEAATMRRRADDAEKRRVASVKVLCDLHELESKANAEEAEAKRKSSEVQRRLCVNELERKRPRR